jgi:RNA polymerase sigma-70 factor, ECF subfamily
MHGALHMGGPRILERIFLDRLVERGGRPPAPSAVSVESALRRADAAGRAAWPNVPLQPEAFAAHVADRVRTGGDPEEAIAGLHAADLFLACACALGIPQALAEFERVELSRVPAVVRRIDASAAFADDVAQAMREAFLVPARGGRARIAEYSGRGPLASWVRVVAVRTALRLGKERRASAPLEGEDELPGIVDPELDHLKFRYRWAYEEAFEAALAALPDRDALMLKLHYVDRLNIDRIGALYGMHRATVARWRARVRRGLLAATREELRRRISMTPAEFESLLALVRSQLVVSIRTALDRPAPPFGG